MFIPERDFFCRHKRVRQPDNIAARDAIPFKTLKIKRCALPGAGAADRIAVHLQAADFGALPSRLNRHLIAGLKRAGLQRAGDDRAKTFHAEHAVNRQTAQPLCRALLNAVHHLRQPGSQLIEPCAGLGRHRHNRSTVKK